MRAWLYLLPLLVAAGVAAGLLLWTRGEAERSGPARVGAERTHARLDTPGATTNVERRNRANAGNREAPEASDEPEPPTGLWYGFAVDRHTGLAVEGAALRVEVLRGDGVFGSGSTLHAGRFVLHATPEMPRGAPLRIVIEAPDGRMGARAVQHPGDAPLDVGTILLSKRHALRGRCVARTQRGIEKVALELRPYNGFHVMPRPMARTVSNDAGDFVFTGVPRGVYALVGRAPDGALFVHTPVLVPGTESLRLKPYPALPIRLQVRNTLGEPQEAVQLRLRCERPTADIDPLGIGNVLLPITLTTDAEGVVETPPLPRGLIEVRVLGTDASFDFWFRSQTAMLHQIFIPTEPRVFVRLVRGRKGKPLANLDVEMNGQRLRTDGDGVVALPRGAPPSLAIAARAPSRNLAGRAVINHRTIAEGQVTAEIEMRSPPAGPAQARDPEPGRMERSARVVRPDGTPVQDVPLLGARRARTNKMGIAELGEMSERSSIRMERPELASGFPSSGYLGDAEQVELVWRRGVPIRVRLTDGIFGFPVDTGVRIGLRHAAWKRVAPGVYESRWDGFSAPNDAVLTIEARGYAPVELELPDRYAPRVEHDVEMFVPDAGPRSNFVLQVFKDGEPVDGALVYVRSLPSTREDLGKRAITAGDGIAILRDLHPGRWHWFVDADLRGFDAREFVMGEGGLRAVAEIRRPPRLTGRVVDAAGRPVERARVRSPQFTRTTRYTNEGGRFAYNQSTFTNGPFQFELDAPGYAPTVTGWSKVKGRLRKRSLVLREYRTEKFRLVWKDVGSEIPENLLLRARFGKRYIDGIVERDTVRFPAYPPKGAKVRVFSRRGDAHLPEQAPDRRGMLRLDAGGVVQGVVTDRGAFALVSVRAHRYSVHMVRADERGRFEVKGVPRGRVTVHVEGQSTESRKRNASMVLRDFLEVRLER
ncbi:MAG: carboxypeptidase-like regulatory domain-containing protein [Planctomycetota bacterium]